MVRCYVLSYQPTEKRRGHGGTTVSSCTGILVLTAARVVFAYQMLRKCHVSHARYVNLGIASDAVHAVCTVSDLTTASRRG